MNFILNIGLHSATLGSFSAEAAKAIVVANDFLTGRELVAQSATEPTLVIEVNTFDPRQGPTLTLQRLRQIAVDLGQDCIAVYRPSLGNGALVGPNTAPWGQFNPEYFIGLDGNTLQ